VLFPTFGAPTKPTSGSSFSSSSRVTRLPSYPRVANLGDGFVVDWKCGFPYPAAPLAATRVPSYHIRGSPSGASGAREADASGEMRPRSRKKGEGGIAPASCDARLALRSPEVPLCLFERGTGSVVVLVCRVVYPAALPPALPVLFLVETSAGFFLGLPLVLRSSRIATLEFANDCTKGYPQITGAPVRPCCHVPMPWPPAWPRTREETDESVLRCSSGRM